jgi:hypothetical protein
MRFIDMQHGIQGNAAIAALVAFAVSAVWAEESLVQFEGRAAYASMQALPYVAPSARSGLLFSTNLYTVRSFSDSLSLVFDHRFYGGDREPIFSEQVHPLDNYLYLALRMQGLGSWQVGASNDLYPFSKPFPLPYYLSNQTVTPQMLNAVDGSWELAGESLRLRAMASYFIYNYELRPLNPFENPLVAQSPPYGEYRDADLWTDISGGYAVAKEITLNAGTFLKNDLNAYNGYDINHYWAGLSGDNQFNRNRMIFAWDARERFLQSQVMSSDGYADGFATDVALRFIWKKHSDFFIKGITRVEFAGRLHKQLYEAMLRKTWDNGSSLDFGYYATSGVLFPRHSVRIANTLRFSSYFGISPSIETFIGRVAQEQVFRYYRSDMSLELLFPLKSRIEAFAGAGYSYYDRHPLFSPRAALYSGLRTW